MISSLVSSAPAIRATRGQLFRVLSLFAAMSAFAGAVFAQTPPTPAPTPATGAAPAADDNTNANGRQRRGQNGGGQNGGQRGNFDPAQIQERMMTALREQFGVTDDAEWKTISDRITAVTELRRSVGGGFGGGFAALRGGQGGQGGGGGGGRPGRAGAAANPEQEALRQAITDNLPDAEIKSRLAHLREVRKTNEEKLTKAQEDLRGILSVRQEAVAVMAGLLP